MPTPKCDKCGGRLARQDEIVRFYKLDVIYCLNCGKRWERIIDMACPKGICKHCGKGPKTLPSRGVCMNCRTKLGDDLDRLYPPKKNTGKKHVESKPPEEAAKERFQKFTKEKIKEMNQKVEDSAFGPALPADKSRIFSGLQLGEAASMETVVFPSRGPVELDNEALQRCHEEGLQLQKDIERCLDGNPPQPDNIITLVFSDDERDQGILKKIRDIAKTDRRDPDKEVLILLEEVLKLEVTDVPTV